MELRSRPIYLVLALLPLVCLIYFVAEYKVDVPHWDQWELVPLLEKSYEGTLTFGNMLAQHNEHRPFFPLLIMIALAHLSDWNISYELAVNVLLGIGIFFVIIHQLRKSDDSIDGQRAYWPIPILSLIVFSLSQSENWLWGWQLQMFLNILAVVAGIVLLSNYARIWLGFCLAIIMGIIGTYSFANGLIYWLTGLLMLLLIRFRDRKDKIIKISIWLVVSLMVICSYMYKYHKPPHHPSLLFSFRQPVEFIKYILTYLGAPLFSHRKEGAIFFGVVGLIILGYLVWVLIKSKNIESCVFLPFLAFSFYSIGSAVITGIARAAFGCKQALNPRYVTVANLLWISNIVLFYLLSKIRNIELKNKIMKIDSAEYGKEEIGSIFSEKTFSRTVRTSVITIIVLFMIVNSVFSMKEFKGRRAWLEPARKELLGPSRDDELLKHIYPKPDTVRTRKEILKKYKLSVFRQ